MRIRATALAFIPALILGGCAGSDATEVVSSASPAATSDSSPLGLRQVLSEAAGFEPGSAPATRSSQSRSLPIQSGNLREIFDQLDCRSFSFGDVGELDPRKPMVTCSVDGKTKYYLYTESVSGRDVESATVYEGVEAGGEWLVSLQFNEQGRQDLASVTAAMRTAESPADQLATVVDGRVVNAPGVRDTVTGGRAEISADFTQEAAAALAARLDP